MKSLLPIGRLAGLRLGHWFALFGLAMLPVEPCLLAAEYQLFAPTNLVAWCIVPFDGKKRGPEERAAMLEKLGFRLFAYDYRAEHVPTFDAEMDALKRHQVRLLAWWFPGVLNDEAKLILEVLQRHGARDVQLWVTGGGEPTRNAEEQATRVAGEAARIKPIAVEAAKIGCSVALYNHGGWFGEPENQIAIITSLRGQGVTNVGIVYNLHHGHDHLDRFPVLLQQMKPYLLALNLNGMVGEGDRVGKKILVIGQGDMDLQLLQTVYDSGWRGPVGILNHTDEDAEKRLRENLAGLKQLSAQLKVKAKPHGRLEEMVPDELETVLREAPVAFVPLGTFEHHGWHLPVCFDGIKAHALCERVAQRTGGAVLPTFFYGTGGGHIGYKWTLIVPEQQITPLIEATLDHLARQGFKVVVLLTGHYPSEQVKMVHRLARAAQQRHPQVRFLGLTEPEITTPEPGDPYGGDHAAKYETSIALALKPEWVHLDRLTAGRDGAQVTLTNTPRGQATTHDPTHPLYAIHGQDPRTTASKPLGEKLVAEIVSRLARQVEEALNGAGKRTEQ